MADDGLEFSTDDTDFTDKMNRKTLFVGTGDQITNIVTTHAGQIVYCIVSGGAFLIDTFYMRNVTNTAWLQGTSAGIESAELTEEPFTDDDTGNFRGTRNMHNIFIAPTKYRFIIITKIEWKVGAVTGGTINCGVDRIDAFPPVEADKPLIGVGQELVMGTINTIQSTSVIACDTIKGGEAVGVWVQYSDITARLRYDNAGGPNENVSYVISYSADPLTQNSIAWSAGQNRIYIKVYYRGYG